MKKDNKNFKGYNLHKKRIDYSSGSIVRSVKIPIDEKNLTLNQKNLLEEIKKSIIKDDLKVRGDVNLNDYLEFTSKNQITYSLIDFWVDSLKAGVIWQEKSNQLVDFINKKILKKDVIDIILESASDEFKCFFDLSNQDLKKFISSNEVRVTSTEKSFKNKLISFLKKDFIKKESDQIIIDENAQKIIDLIVTTFFKDNQLILKGQHNQNKFWKEKFNIDKSIFEKFKPQGDLKDLTFMIIPELIAIDKDISIENLIELRINFFNLKDNEIKGIIGLENNFNAFSNYYGKVFRLLYDKKINEIYNALVSLNPQLTNNKDLLLKSLSYLSEKTQLIGAKPSFNLINSWSDLRMMIGGKIESWLSNYLRRKNELNNQLENFFNSINNLNQLIINKKLDYKKQPSFNDVENLKIQINKITQLKNQNLTDKNNYEVFDLLISEFKRDLNFFYQRYLVDEKENKPITKIDIFKEIFKEIYKPMSFYGEQKKLTNKKNSQLILPIIKVGIKTIKENLNNFYKSFQPEKFIDNNKITEDFFLKNLLNFYFNKIKNQSFNDQEFKKYFIEKIKNLIIEDFNLILKKKNLNSYTFAKSDYSTANLKILQLKTLNYLDEYKKIIKEIIDYLNNFETNQLLTNKTLLLDWIEISKNTTSQLIKYSYKDEFEIINLDELAKTYDKLDKYIKLFNLKKITKYDLNKIWQSLFLSELKGVATLYSKEYYLSKYICQFIGSDKKINLYIYSDDQETSKDLDLEKYDIEQRKKYIKKIKYYIDFGLVKENKKIKSNDDICLIKIGKEKLEKIYLSKEDFDKLYRLTTSAYQFQFLDKLIYKPKHWQSLNIELSEWSLITEKYFQIQWQVDQNMPNFKYLEDSRKNKLYLTIPLNFSEKSSSDKNISKYKLLKLKPLNFPILGIDVGEYGLGYCLININNNLKIISKGFIEDKNIARIKDEFHKIQEKSKKGIFNQLDTTLTKIRENAIGKLRNRVHGLVINFSSTPIYESSISNFETGSKRTINIYNSVKKADVYTEETSKADEAIKKAIWGYEKIAIGKNVSAYGSSYTCIKCKRSIYQLEDLNEDEIKKIYLIKREGNILEFKYNDFVINGFYEKKDKFNIENQSLTKSDFKIFIKSLKNFARPPLINSEVIKKYAVDLENNQEKLINFKKSRGNSAIFICPFSDCHFVADADIQAAFIMAIRGYIKFNTNKDEEVDYFQKTIQLLNQFSFSDYHLIYPSI